MGGGGAGGGGASPRSVTEMSSSFSLKTVQACGLQDSEPLVNCHKKYHAKAFTYRDRKMLLVVLPVCMGVTVICLRDTHEGA